MIIKKTPQQVVQLLKNNKNFNYRFLFESKKWMNIETGRTGICIDELLSTIKELLKPKINLTPTEVQRVLLELYLANWIYLDEESIAEESKTVSTDRNGNSKPSFKGGPLNGRYFTMADVINYKQRNLI